MDFLAQKLITVRKAKGWTVREAERRTGIKLSTLTCLESGKVRNPRKETIAKLCGGFGVPESYFFSQTTPAHILPELPYDLLCFVIDPTNIEYLAVVAEAKKNGVSASSLKMLADVLTKERKVDKKKNSQRK